MRRNTQLYPMLVTAVLLAIGLVLPFLTGQLQSIGQLLSPLHIPALICGLTCGPFWGGLLGAVLPLLRMSLFGMPPLPAALPMTFELCVYGAASGLLYPLLAKGSGRRMPAMLGALVSAMVLGRVAGGAAKALLLAGGAISANAPFTFAAFLTGYFADTAAGAAIHLVLVPAVVLALEKAKLSPLGQRLQG